MVLDTEKVELRVSNERAYVWEVQDIATLRSKHRICGLLGGTMPHLSQQNVFLGVPLMLMPEEVVLLVEKEFAVIVDDAAAHHEPLESEKSSWNENRRLEQHRSAEQKEDLKKGDIISRKAQSEEAILKRKQREARRAALADAGAVDASVSTQNVDQVVLTSSSPALPAPSTGAASSSSYTVTIPTTSTPLPWYNSSKHTYATIAEARVAGVWSYPSSPIERARCGVFRVLWEKGFYMGCGIKFGGQYLVYPGDPLRYHSHFVASVLESPDAPLRPMEIVAHGRLSTATKKAHLFCAWDEERQDADIYSIEWAGFG